MKKVEAIIRPEKVDAVKEALAETGFVGLNIVQVIGRGSQKGIVHAGRGGEARTVDMLLKVKMEVVVRDADMETVVDIIAKAARTGSTGDGKIFVTPIIDALRVRTGERGEVAV